MFRFLNRIWISLVLLLSTIDYVRHSFSILQLLYFYMDGHFQRESADRLMLLHALRSLNAVLANTSPFSAKCFLKLFSHLTTKSKASTSNSNYSGWASSTPSDHDLHLQSKPLFNKVTSFLEETPFQKCSFLRSKQWSCDKLWPW